MGRRDQDILHELSCPHPYQGADRGLHMLACGIRARKDALAGGPGHLHDLRARTGRANANDARALDYIVSALGTDRFTAGVVFPLSRLWTAIGHSDPARLFPLYSG